MSTASAPPTTTEYRGFAAEKLLVSIAEGARLLSISRRKLEYEIAAKSIVTVKIGRRVLIPFAALKKFARGNHVGRVAKPAGRISVLEKATDTNEQAS